MAATGGTELNDTDLEPMSHVREQYKEFRTPARDDSVWEEGPVVGLIVASSIGPDFIGEMERHLEHMRTTTERTGGGIFDLLFFAKHPEVVEYVRPRSPGEFGEHEEDIPPRFQHTRVTNLTRLALLLQATVLGATEPAEIAQSMEVHRWAPVVLQNIESGTLARDGRSALGVCVYATATRSARVNLTISGHSSGS